MELQLTSPKSVPKPTPSFIQETERPSVVGGRGQLRTAWIPQLTELPSRLSPLFTSAHDFEELTWSPLMTPTNKPLSPAPLFPRPLLCRWEGLEWTCWPFFGLRPPRGVRQQKVLSNGRTKDSFSGQL